MAKREALWTALALAVTAAILWSSFFFIPNLAGWDGATRIFGGIGIVAVHMIATPILALALGWAIDNLPVRAASPSASYPASPPAPNKPPRGHQPHRQPSWAKIRKSADESPETRRERLLERFSEFH